MNYSIYFTLHTLFYKLNVGTKVRHHMVCFEISKRETKRRVSEPVAFSCLEYLIATTKQILALAMGKRCGLDSDLSNLRIRIRAVFPLHICSCLNKLQSTHVENKCFKLSFSSMWGDELNGWFNWGLEPLYSVFIPKYIWNLPYVSSIFFLLTHREVRSAL